MTADDPSVRDVVVVGAGPVGLFATYYAGFRGLRVTVVDAQSEAGGQITALYPGKLIHDVAGFPAVTGRALVNGLLTQAKEYGPRMLFDTDVRGVRQVGGGFEVDLSDDRTIRTRTVVLATGVGGIHPRPLPVGHDWHGRGLVYVVTDTAAHAEHDVVVVGGGDAALDWALQLRAVARSVTLVHRRRSFRAHQGRVDRAAALAKALETDKMPLGVLYRREGRPVFEEQLAAYRLSKVPLARRSDDRRTALKRSSTTARNSSLVSVLSLSGSAASISSFFNRT